MKKLSVIILSLITIASCFSFVAAAEPSDDINYIRLTEGESVSFKLTAEVDGEYYYSITYKTVEGRQISPEAELKLTNGNTEYNQHIELTRIWSDIHTGNRFETDKYGNEITPQVTEKNEWQTGIYGISSEFGNQSVNLQAGVYNFEISILCETVDIAEIYFYSKELISYADYISDKSSLKNEANEESVIQAELMSAKSHSSILASYDRSSPSIQPNYADKIALNIVGGASFSEVGQWVEWEFDVAESGFYSIDVKYEQDSLRGLGVGRRIRIDGEVPFLEFDNILFPYAQNFQTVRLSDNDNNPYKIYLEAGKHTIRMEVNEDHIENEILALRKLIMSCNSMYRQIISITGSTPDTYRDYYLDKELPELIPFLENSVSELKEIIKNINKSSDGSGSETSSLDEVIRVFENFIKKPHKIPAGLDSFKNSIDSLANTVVTLEAQGLTLDYIVFSPENADLQQRNSNFFNYLWFRSKSFFFSFVSDYSVTSGSQEEAIKVWINMSGGSTGRDQMQLIKRLCDDSFSGSNNVGVNFSLVSAGDTLVQAVLADKGPDVALFVDEQIVANLAYRGVLADMQDMNDFEGTKNQYYESSFIPYTINNSVYAMPVTQSFNMMFYRTDVFEELGLEPPQTWDDFYAVQKVLIQQKLEIGITESQDIFEMFLLQAGGNIYNEDFTASALKTQNAVNAFTRWTDLYVKHGLPLVFSFFNRFRTGEMPLGIMNYTTYNQLVVAAPELEGLWEMLPIPGVLQEDGTIKRTQSSANTGCIIVNKSETNKNNLEASYAFMKWWSDSEIQTQFGRQVESLLGKSGRYSTANKITFENLNWTSKERENLTEAWKDVTDIPMTVASYYINRCVSNAFRRVAYSYENARDVLYRYADDIDHELERKNEVMNIGRE